MRSSSHIVRSAVALAATAAVLVPATASATGCRSSDMRYPFQAGGPKDFGVFKLRITNGSCATARRIAKAWKKDFETALRNGKVRLPKQEGGFSFKTLKPTAAQTYNERGRKGSTTIRFDYRVPNG